MKASFYCVQKYFSPQPMRHTWPEAPRLNDSTASVDSYRLNMEQVLMADELGFDWVSFSEHHYSGNNMSPSPMVAASFIAARLKNARPAVLGPTMPLNNPVRIAEEFALLDNLTNGRVIVGMLRGTANEFQTYSSNPIETRDRTTEGMELMIKAWTEPEPFSWEGRYYQYRTVCAWPQPVQKPFPLTYILGNSKESCDFAAENHLGIGLAHGGFDVVARSSNYYREQCVKNGWEATPDHIIYRDRCYVAESDAKAEDGIRQYWVGDSGDHRRVRSSVAVAVQEVDPNPFHTGGAPMPGYAALDRSTIVRGPGDLDFAGGPDTVIEQFKRCKEITGAGVIDISFQGGSLDFKNTVRSIELFGKEVLPAIREL